MYISYQYLLQARWFANVLVETELITFSVLWCVFTLLVFDLFRVSYCACISRFTILELSSISLMRIKALHQALQTLLLFCGGRILCIHCIYYLIHCFSLYQGHSGVCPTESERYLQTSDFWLLTSDFGLQTSDFRCYISLFLLQTSHFRLECYCDISVIISHWKHAFYLDRYCYICKMELSTEERNSLIKDYFTNGLTQKEIRNILMYRHNHIVSLVHLKRLGPVVQLVVKF